MLSPVRKRGSEPVSAWQSIACEGWFSHQYHYGIVCELWLNHHHHHHHHCLLAFLEPPSKPSSPSTSLASALSVGRETRIWKVLTIIIITLAIIKSNFTITTITCASILVSGLGGCLLRPTSNRLARCRRRVDWDKDQCKYINNRWFTYKCHWECYKNRYNIKQTTITQVQVHK